MIGGQRRRWVVGGVGVRVRILPDFTYPTGNVIEKRRHLSHDSVGR